MTPFTTDRLKQIKDFESLIDFLREELDWPLDAEEIEDLTFEYEPEELGLSEEVAVKVNFIKQLRPLAHNQPWGIFYIDFEPKKLPVVVLRRVLQKLVIKKRVTADTSSNSMWNLNDLLFINSFGVEEDRAITFAHFKEEDSNLPTLKVIGWDGQDTPLHMDRCLDELSKLNFDPELDPDQWRQQWSSAFRAKHQQVINTSKSLAATLASLAQSIRETAKNILKYEKSDGTFHKTLEKFKQALIHDLTEDDFADMYAQTITYGLLYTAIKSHVSGEPNQVSSERVQQLVLPTNPFLKEVMEGFFNIGSRKWDSEKEQITGIDFDELGINDILATLKDENTDFDAVLRDFNNRNPNEDPVIHFYELFLKAYDALKRKSRGVYYTPQPVVSFIVRSVHEVLKKDFDLSLGLADTATWGQMIKKNPEINLPEGVSENDFFVQILDPATGTGTFLVETIDLIHKTMFEHWQNEDYNESEIKKLWSKYVPQSLLPRLYGFELMMAPYAIAHMKIGIKLFETGYTGFAEDKQRVKVYLTNTLEKAVDTSGYLDTLDPAMAEETKEANEVKTAKAITVTIGNPPYSGHSFNNSQWIYDLLRKKLTDDSDSYFKIDGNDLGERNPKWLNDDYVKFIRYCQNRLAEVGTGIHGFITNHAYIDNPTFRGMRQSLLSSYNGITIVDLHGSAKKKEKCPDGSKDENVFDIQQGVAIQICVKKTDLSRRKYSHLWGIRSNKFNDLNDNIIQSLISEDINPSSDMYLLCPQDDITKPEYDCYQKITEIIPDSVLGFQTHRDSLVIDFTKKSIKDRVSRLIDSKISDSYFYDSFSIKDNDSWSLTDARKKIRKDKGCKNVIFECLYRPFDNRYIFLSGYFVDRPRRQLLDHVLAKDNICLLTSRQISSDGWRHVWIDNTIAESCAVSLKTKEGNYNFPLYSYPVTGELAFSDADWPAGKNGRTPNLEKTFVQKLSSAISLEFISDGSGNLKKTFGPEDILAYIYAVFHSPTYRNRYAEFLKMDFPRVPITSDTAMFRKLVKLGSELISLHLMESDKLEKHITDFPITGDNSVTKVGETGKQLKDVNASGKGKLYINSSQYFDNIPEEVWNFHVGGYQVCYKWLADRKKAGRKLSTEDIEHYHRIVVALSETIKLMAKIDETIEDHTGWPIN